MASTPPARPRSGLGSSRRRTPGTSGRHPSSGTASVGSAGATDPVTDTRLAAPPRSPYDRYLISAKPIRMPKLIPSDPLGYWGDRYLWHPSTLRGDGAIPGRTGAAPVHGERGAGGRPRRRNGSGADEHPAHFN